MKEVIAMHGWGSDSHSWEEWQKHFTKNEWIWNSVERGYGILKPNEVKWSKTNKNHIQSKRVVICHSLGAHLINPNIIKEATDIVLISSFGRFIPKGKENRSVKVALNGMRQALGSKKEKQMLNNFLVKACQPYSINSLPPGPITKGISAVGREMLKKDLELLINLTGLPKGLTINSRVLIIYGEEDSIILPSTINLFINELIDFLQVKPHCWPIPKEGHSILIPGIIQKVEEWLELNQ